MSDTTERTDHAAAIREIMDCSVSHDSGDTWVIRGPNMDAAYDALDALAAERDALLNLASALAIIVTRQDRAKGVGNHTINWLADGHSKAMRLVWGSGALDGMLDGAGPTNAESDMAADREDG